jgi:hypothetical protein
MSTPEPRVDVNLLDLKGRKGHICLGGSWGDGTDPVCGCGARLRGLTDFMDLDPVARRNVATVLENQGGRWSVDSWRPPHDFPNEEPPLVTGDDVPPAPFNHANGEPCYGCQSCLADAIEAYWTADTDDGDADLVAEADAIEAPGHAVQVKQEAPDMNPAVPVIDPSQPYGPAEVERAILDANRRLELGLKHEANLIAATEQAKIEYELAFARAIERSAGGAADIRKANAVLASERQYRAWIDAKAARDAMKSITHTLRSTVSALQSVSRSVGTSYTGPQGRGH